MKPTQGEKYTTKEGDTLESIAAQAYGDPTQFSLIQDVNPMQAIVQSDESLPAGQSLLIPTDTETEQLWIDLLQNGLGNTR